MLDRPAAFPKGQSTDPMDGLEPEASGAGEPIHFPYNCVSDQPVACRGRAPQGVSVVTPGPIVYKYRASVATTMETVVLVNAAPGYEERVATALRKEDGVAGISRVEEESFNMAVLLQLDGPNELQKFLTNTLMFISGVQGAELAKDPEPDLMNRLKSSL